MLTLRKATQFDSNSILQLSNDSFVRQQSFSSEKISPATHKEWFAKKIDSKDCLFYVVEKNGQMAGQLRFDINSKIALISISLCPKYRGQGLAHEIIDLGITLASHEQELQAVHAYIKNNNATSIKVFERLGFIETTETKGLHLNSKTFELKL